MKYRTKKSLECWKQLKATILLCGNRLWKLRNFRPARELPSNRIHDQGKPICDFKKKNPLFQIDLKLKQQVRMQSFSKDL